MTTTPLPASGKRKAIAQTTSDERKFLDAHRRAEEDERRTISELIAAQCHAYVAARTLLDAVAR
jgi:hypothetical protein